MSLDLTKLEKVANLANGLKRAQCPACAEAGQDKTGEHLRIYPDGRFGCCVHPKDREHRKRIFALVGERGRQEIKVRVMPPKATGAVQSGILGRLGRLFPSPAQKPVAPESRDGAAQQKTVVAKVGTLGTGGAKSNRMSAAEGRLPLGELGTLGTPHQNPRAVVERGGLVDRDVYTHKEFRGGVPSVPDLAGAKPGRLPYLTPDGTLGIPFDAPERFHWWKPGGQSLKETIAEVRSRMTAERKDCHGTTV